MILAFDTETTGLIDKAKPLGDDSQPRIVQVGAILAEDNGDIVTEIRDIYIRPAGWKTKPGAETVHGISDKMANRFGISEIAALGLIVGLSANVKRVIGHGVEFDRDIVSGTLMRLGKSTELFRRPRLQWCCTMKGMNEICSIESQYVDGASKWPTLAEAYLHAFGREPVWQHSAFYDAHSALEIYLWLVENGYQEE